MKKLFSVDFQLYKVTGVEKVMLDIHHAVKDVYQAKVVGNIPYNKIRVEHEINRNEYVKFKNLFMFRDSIVIVHERRLLMMFWLLNHILFQNIKIVYVHHNIFHNHKITTILPQNIVAIADRGVENLTKFFGASKSNIHKIYNCVTDEYESPHRMMRGNIITLLLPGRINEQKRQLEIVQYLSGKIDHRILIRFAGDGPYLDELKKACEGDANFEVLGFRNDVKQLLKETDFMLLFSAHEGLPITLIEATMVGMPIVCNDVGGNAEICHDGENGWVVNRWDELIDVINKLPNISDEQYRDMCQKSRKIYEDTFTFDQFKKNYLNLLSNLK